MRPPDPPALAPLLDEAREFAVHMPRSTDRLQGLGLLAIAEAVHRLAAAVERLTDQ